ncbi:hypothetical protein ES706_02033 [subsurface metagenome]
MTMNIIGIDCATKQAKIGLAFALYQDGKAIVRDVKIGSETTTVLVTIKDWLASGKLTLLALDAPLGWPTDLGVNLHLHKAGECINVDPDIMFSRYTDRKLWPRLSRKPLEVGANLIARTAHAALRLLGQLREETKLTIPLAWDPNVTETCAIEVYPRATLEMIGIKYEQRLSAIREIDALVIESGEDNLTSEHSLDAVICVLAAVDFITGKCPAPNMSEKVLADKEGWIWVRGSRGKMKN